MNVYLDIETIPTTDAEVIRELKSTIAPPGNIKKQESIDAWMKENAESAANDLVAKTSFDGMYGRIACIAWAFGDGEIQSTSKDDSEADALRLLYSTISVNDTLTVVGHNVAGFDLPFLKHRSIILGIKPPPAIRRAMNAKPWSEFIADTMLMWSDNRDKRASMDKLCRVLGIPGKDGFDGSMVAETWPVNPQKVIDYCKDDVSRTRAIYKRLTFTNDLQLVDVSEHADCGG